jgi:hypothetical protein
MSRANSRLPRRILELLEQSPERKRTREELDEVLVGAEGLPANVEWLSKNVRTIAATTEGLTFDDGWRGRERILKLGLVNAVDAANPVGPSPTSTNGTDGTNGKYEGGER